MREMSGSLRVAEEVRRILVRTARLPMPPEEIALDTPLSGGGLELASLELMEVVLALEERFGVEVPDDVLPRLNSVRAIAAFVEEARRG